MLRGVNRQIIEINSTDNSYFEKAILFVRPEFSDLSENKLRDNADSFLNEVVTVKITPAKLPDNKSKSKEKNKKLSFSIISTIAGIVVVGLILIKFMA